jgi:hypothetical protein
MIGITLGRRNADVTAFPLQIVERPAAGAQVSEGKKVAQIVEAEAGEAHVILCGSFHILHSQDVRNTQQTLFQFMPITR